MRNNGTVAALFNDADAIAVFAVLLIVRLHCRLSEPGMGRARVAFEHDGIDDLV